MKEIDARGLQCPKPLMMAKKELESGSSEFDIVVSNEAAVNNLSHLAKRMGCMCSVREGEGEWTLSFTSNGCKPCEEENEAGTSALKDYAVFIGKDHVGEGDETLGQSLMKMALYTLSESEDIPSHVLFMNSGVKLVAQADQQIIDSVSALIAQGSEVLVCGTCLDYYNLTESLQVGTVSNMYDILGCMQTVSKVITL